MCNETLTDIHIQDEDIILYTFALA
jgi:hypothetical protein